MEIFDSIADVNLYCFYINSKDEEQLIHELSLFEGKIFQFESVCNDPTKTNYPNEKLMEVEEVNIHNAYKFIILIIARRRLL